MNIQIALLIFLINCLTPVVFLLVMGPQHGRESIYPIIAIFPSFITAILFSMGFK